MKSPLSRLALLAGILVALAALFQKQIANATGNPMTEPTTLEQVVSAVKGAAGTALIQVPTHPVAAVIFWAGLAVAGFALFAWIVEDCFWLPLIAACLGLAAAVFKLAWLPVLLAAAKAGQSQVRRRRSTVAPQSSSRRGRPRL
ncbi:MAG: hypothetical protein KA004_13460 [Verrucomicrobiales bacterium]|nr:hypothetical protein [Verrucomicrobiales bacterium]